MQTLVCFRFVILATSCNWLCWHHFLAFPIPNVLLGRMPKLIFGMHDVATRLRLIADLTRD